MIIAIAVALAVGSGWQYYSSPPPSGILNDKKFTPYTITSREPISPTSFILKATPQHPSPALGYLHPSTSIWRHAHWSVEFKQPEVQIARHYTPLPPLDSEDPADGSLRFYIRTVEDGEMSNYLSRLTEGRDVWLRGPHAGFDLAERLGAKRDVVFLAGGTGVVPAMQAAHVLLNSTKDVRFNLLWAVRKREELQSVAPEAKPRWALWSKREAVAVDAGLEAPSPVARQLQAMKTKYGDRLRIQVSIDEEVSFFREKDIQNALLRTPHGDLQTSGMGCLYHDQRLHEAASEFQTPEHACQCDNSKGESPGKNLFVVAGPQGFVTYFAGQKVWRGGQERQGTIGGVAERLQKQHPHLARDWIVLKL